jgi:hypothetical protein
MRNRVLTAVVLRHCSFCGANAITEEDLENFVKGFDRKHGRKNVCKACANKMLRKGGTYHPSKKRWHKQHNPKRIRFKTRQISLPKNVRTNTCSSCGQRFPDEMKKQTHMHHDVYDAEDPLIGTKELCGSCHTKLHGSSMAAKRWN